jgi:AcrR family transcriptional regulator
VVLPPAARQQRIFEALEAVYLENGLDGASMDAVAARAGMSKRTIYAIFASRAELLRSYLEQYGGGFIRPLPVEARGLPLAARLRQMISPELCRGGFSLPLEILRGLVAEMPVAPEIACGVLERTSDLYRQMLADELERGCARGEIALEDVPAAAGLLLDMLRPWPMESLLDPARVPDDDTFNARLDLAISIFVKGAAPQT